MREIDLKSYAKVNLSLDVTGTRPDGYHDLSSVMQRISLYDRIHMEWIRQEEAAGEEPDIRIEVKTNRPYLPVDERNLAYKAAQIMIRHFAREAGVGSGIIRISITKSIPVAAGLAGGSGNGAAVLIGLNRLWNLKLDTRQLCRVGEELGSDVPFCVLVQNSRYRAALATGRGEVLHPLKKCMKKYVVLAKPSFGVSTKEVFKCIDDYEITQRPDNGELIRGLAAGDDRLVYKNMINVLELYTLDHYDPVAQLKEICRTQTPAEMVLMSGSGPTVFAVYASEKEARSACQLLRGMRYEAYWAGTDGR
ncbi:MAG: 4-(cytidine 5'-diphospho)-2-C-methyl-D-erythritol kinase [Firmicutes bacterium]|nr:4-(cytidine 5'-diphospho)-2-C-methyl-D-erythritol kinase [Bacillota bacterium]